MSCKAEKLQLTGVWKSGSSVFSLEMGLEDVQADLYLQFVIYLNNIKY